MTFHFFHFQYKFFSLIIINFFQGAVDYIFSFKKRPSHLGLQNQHCQIHSILFNGQPCSFQQRNNYQDISILPEAIGKKQRNNKPVPLNYEAGILEQYYAEHVEAAALGDIIVQIPNDNSQTAVLRVMFSNNKKEVLGFTHGNMSYFSTCHSRLDLGVLFPTMNVASALLLSINVPKDAQVVACGALRDIENRNDRCVWICMTLLYSL